jgi:hypothetical protein
MNRPVRQQRLTPRTHVAAPRPNIELHIEQLTLHGFAPADRDRIGAAIQAELARLIAERGAPSSLLTGGAVERLDGGAFQLAPGARPESIGGQVASAVYGRLER